MGLRPRRRDVDPAEQTGHDPPRSKPCTSGASESPAPSTSDQRGSATETAGAPLLRGLGAAPGIAAGAVRVLSALAEAERLADGDVLVTHMTAPDWVPLMRRAAAIVTDSGGMTCHAAIVSRELGIPCVVGTGEATRKLRDGELVTVNATSGAVFEGAEAAMSASATTPSQTATAVSGGPSECARGGTSRDRHQPSGQPLRALAGRARRGARRRWSGAPARRADGARGARGRPSANAARGGPRRGLRGRDGRWPQPVRHSLLAPPRHLPHDRLPHQRVPRPARRRALRAAGVKPDDRLSRSAPLHARARGLRARAAGAATCLAGGPPQPPRDASVRAQHRRASPLPRADRAVGAHRASPASSCG